MNVFQGRLPVRWMAIESLNYSVYTTKSDVYVHQSAFQCSAASTSVSTSTTTDFCSYSSSPGAVLLILRYLNLTQAIESGAQVLIMHTKNGCPHKTTNHPSVTAGMIKRPLRN